MTQIMLPTTQGTPLIILLPREVFISTLLFLPGDEIMKCSRICKEWFAMIAHVDHSRERTHEIKGKKKNRQIQNMVKTDGRDFWINVCNDHFKDAMVMRRKYPSQIQPVTYYVLHYRDALLVSVYNLEKSLCSLEKALESESSLFSDVCIFSIDLMEMYVKLYNLQRYYGDVEGAEFNNHELDLRMTFYPVLEQYRKSRDECGNIKLVALVKLNAAQIGRDKLRRLVLEQSEWKPSSSKATLQDEEVKRLMRELLEEKLDVETLEDFGRDEQTLAKTYDSDTLRRVLKSTSSVEEKLTELYSAWTRRWRKVLLTRSQYKHVYNHVDMNHIDSVLVDRGFEQGNGTRYANNSLQRKNIYAMFLQKKLTNVQ
ncbi:F-box/LRR-repeat protein [Acrasis kona]|uniref:F-box/LRR-repeat protein n=1 Tax=Acrasis kona TaxID=1008807 RepID=A0AAW2ZMU0_9EUKA